MTGSRRLVAGFALLAPWFLGGCPSSQTPSDTTQLYNGGAAPVYNNTTDPTNKNATYIGSGACKACHPAFAALHAEHGHAQILKKISDGAPTYPTLATNGGVPNPPAGYDWPSIAYVLGGYAKSAVFIDSNGYLLTTGVAGTNTLWNTNYPLNGAGPAFALYLPNNTAPQTYAYSCFRCHTTAPVPFNAAAPKNQDNRPGILGTWGEEGVQCEACHGPGSNHVPNPAAREIYVNSSAAACGTCHAANTNLKSIAAADGFIQHHQQSAELAASGSHSHFECGICHDPHASTTYDRARGLRNNCTTCHTAQNLAFHEGVVFQRGDYQEPVTCASCHMPLATKNVTSADPSVAGLFGRIGDARTHIFRIDAHNADYTKFFSADGTAVVTDSTGRAAVSLDFVCMRCHNSRGNAFELSRAGAETIAPGMHERVPNP